MISEALGLLLGQVAILSMERFFRALPKLWLREHIHPIIGQLLRCCLPIDITNSRSKLVDDGSTLSPKWQKFRWIDAKVQFIIDSITKMLWKLHNYDKNLISIEETFIGSTIMLFIIFSITFTLFLWLRRLSYELPNKFPQNYVEKLMLEKISRKSPNKLTGKQSILQPKITLSNNTINSSVQSIGKLIVNELGKPTDIRKPLKSSTESTEIRNDQILKMHRNQQIYSMAFSNCFNKHTHQQIRSRTLKKQKRQKYIPIILFLSDETTATKQIFSPPSSSATKQQKKRYKRIF